MKLKKYWYIAAKSSELSGKPIRSVIFDERIVLFRQSDGEPAALVDRCAHRNMALSAGRVDRDLLECPYHGWKYDKDGTCEEVPSLEDTAKLSGAKLVRTYPVRESQGFIWVFMGEGEPPGPPFNFPCYRESGWTSFTMKTRFQASVFNCLENFLDVPHTAHVHKGWFRSRTTKRITAKVHRSSVGVDVEFIDEPELKSLIGRVLVPFRSRAVHTDRFIMPNVSRVDYRYSQKRHFIITSQCTPISDCATEVYTVITFRYGPINVLVRLFFEPISRIVIKQDVKALKLQTEQIKHFDGPQFTFVETDLVGRHIQALWRWAADEGAAQRPIQESEREVVIRF